MTWIWWPALIAGPGALLLLSGFVNLYAGRYWRAGQGLFSGSLFTAIAVAMVLFGMSLQSYWRMSYELPLVEVSVQSKDVASKHFLVVIRHLDGEVPPQTCELQGDEWLLSARVQKWKPWATLFGINATYTLDQVSNKYISALEANGKPITACALGDTHPIYVPEHWLETLISFMQVEDRHFGSANYMPLADGAVYTLLMTQSGLNAEPANEIARAANHAHS